VALAGTTMAGTGSCPTGSISIATTGLYPYRPVPGQGPECYVFFEYTGGPQHFSVPASVKEVRADVGGGSASGTNGGEVWGSFAVRPGEVLTIVVGGNGKLTGTAYGGGGAAFGGHTVDGQVIGPVGGGGGSFVFAPTLLLAAGGGGGHGGSVDPGAGGEGGGATGGDKGTPGRYNDDGPDAVGGAGTGATAHGGGAGGGHGVGRMCLAEGTSGHAGGGPATSPSSSGDGGDGGFGWANGQRCASSTGGGGGGGGGGYYGGGGGGGGVYGGGGGGGGSGYVSTVVTGVKSLKQTGSSGCPNGWFALPSPRPNCGGNSLGGFVTLNFPPMVRHN
jgi:hypothetical protein